MPNFAYWMIAGVALLVASTFFLPLPTVTIAAMLAIGAFAAACGGYYVYNGRRSASWPGVDGEILEFERQEVQFAGDHFWKVGLRYRYQVKGHWYESRRRAFTNSYVYDAEADALASRYSNGRKVVVFVNPANPRDAVLEPGVGGAWTGVLIGGLAMFLVALLFPGLVIAVFSRRLLS